MIVKNVEVIIDDSIKINNENNTMMISLNEYSMFNQAKTQNMHNGILH